MLSASEVPVRKRNVGAHKCVTQRVKKSAAGIRVPAIQIGAPVSGFRRYAESAVKRPAFHISEAWSSAMSTMTKPRIQSMA